MTKKPTRPSINSALAELAEAGEQVRSNANTLQRENLQGDNVLNNRIASADAAGRDNVTTPEGYKIRRRVEKPHVSLYVHPKVIRTVREIAMAKGRKAHDVYIDGLRMALKAHGYDYDELSRLN